VSVYGVGKDQSRSGVGASKKRDNCADLGIDVLRNARVLDAPGDETEEADR
jgi:hypothetical protein